MRDLQGAFGGLFNVLPVRANGSPQYSTPRGKSSGLLRLGACCGILYSLEIVDICIGSVQPPIIVTIVR